MTVYLVISLPKIPYIYTVYIWFWPTLIVIRRGTATGSYAAEMLLISLSCPLPLRRGMRVVYIIIFVRCEAVYH